MAKRKTDSAQWFVTNAELMALMHVIATDLNNLSARLDTLEAPTEKPSVLWKPAGV